MRDRGLLTSALALVVACTSPGASASPSPTVTGSLSPTSNTATATARPVPTGVTPAPRLPARVFMSATWVAHNHPIGSGNSFDNTAELYPNAILSGERWYLVGVVHGERSI